jgi:hypothetical protein
MLGVNPLSHPICFTRPLRVAMSSWIGHVPFGMYLIDVLRPKALAELGTHYGVSYCAFCQAVKELGLDTRCFAIDTWQQDAEEGVYGPEVLADLEEHHKPLYGSFSRLIQSTSDEALDYFAEGAFDLLHLDGYHTYEAVKADFEKWLPKMSDRGIVLFRDINPGDGDENAGVAKFWDELKLQYPSFEFVHSNGLGVLAVGNDYPEELNALLHSSKAEVISVRRFFSTFGARLEALRELQNIKPELQTSKAQPDTLMTQIPETTQEISALTTQLRERDEQIRERGLELIGLKSQLEDLTRQQEGLRRRTSEEDVLLVEKDMQLHSAIKQAQENLHKLQEQAKLITELRQDLKDRDIRAEGIQLELQEQAQVIAGLRQDLKDRDVKLQLAAFHIRTGEKRTQELAHLLAGMQDIRQTGSYRFVRALSAPLRWKYRLTLKRYLQGLTGGSISQQPSPEPQKEVYLQESIVAPPSKQFAKKKYVQPASAESQTEALFDAEWCVREHTWLYNNVSTGETALFDAEWYLRENPDVADAKVNPLVHFLRWGAREGRAPHPLFDPKFYIKTYPESAIGGGANPLQHYLTGGWKKGYKPNPKFDPTFYLVTYPDIVEAGVEPLTHFVTNGLREGRSACAEDVYLEPFEADFDIPREPNPRVSIAESDVKAIAFYLPQFHPIPENDEWWGTGFTEWTNVRRGEPQFPSHYQPHVPSDLDYYDLRETQVIERQVALAKDYGIHGFCFYYYWFAGKVLLDLPIRRMLETGKPDFPFCICWANENWTRRWDGQEKEILIGQRHSPEDDLAFLNNIEPILLHKNYIRVEGKPLLILYQPSFLPDARATAARWRDAFRSRGHGEIFLAAMQTFSHRTPPQDYGFDAVIQFPPHHTNSAHITGLAKGLDSSFAGGIYDYNKSKWFFIDELYQLSNSRRIYPGVMPSWDNTARLRRKSNIWINSSPESYYDWLWQVTSFLRRNRPNDEKLVFINAWNEWAEGCHLEPDQTFGYAWLNATRLALQTEGAFAENGAGS